MGRRPELNTEEFSYLPLLVVEIISILCLKPPKMCYIVWEHDPSPAPPVPPPLALPHAAYTPPLGPPWPTAARAAAAARVNASAIIAAIAAVAAAAQDLVARARAVASVFTAMASRRDVSPHTSPKGGVGGYLVGMGIASCAQRETGVDGLGSSR